MGEGESERERARAERASGRVRAGDCERGSVRESSHELTGGARRPRAGDVLVVTSPKCGTTWVQQIVHQLRSRGSMDFEEISIPVPWIEMAHDLGQVAPRRRERGGGGVSHRARPPARARYARTHASGGAGFDRGAGLHTTCLQDALLVRPLPEGRRCQVYRRRARWGVCPAACRRTACIAPTHPSMDAWVPARVHACTRVPGRVPQAHSVDSCECASAWASALRLTR